MSFIVEGYDLNEKYDIKVGSIPNTPDGLKYGLPQENETWTKSGLESITPQMGLNISL